MFEFVLFRHLFHHYRLAVKIGVGKQISDIAEIQNRKEKLPILLFNAGTAPDDLFELRHRTDVAVQHNQLAGFGVDASGHQLRGGGNHRIGFFGIDKIIQFPLAFLIIARNLHDIAGILNDEIGIGVSDGGPHALGVFNIHTEDNGFVEAIVFFEEFGYFDRHRLGALVNH